MLTVELNGIILETLLFPYFPASPVPKRTMNFLWEEWKIENEEKLPLSLLALEKNPNPWYHYLLHNFFYAIPQRKRRSEYALQKEIKREVYGR